MQGFSPMTHVETRNLRAGGGLPKLGRERVQVARREGLLAGDCHLFQQELREEIGALRKEMQAGFKELHARISNLADRVSKVEGIIEGLFWGTRNQPPEKSREGVA